MRPRPWSDVEERIVWVLVVRFGVQTGDLARLLGRSKDACGRAAWRQGLRFRDHRGASFAWRSVAP